MPTLAPTQPTTKKPDDEILIPNPKFIKDLNKPEDSRCALPTQPNYDVDDSEAGYRFFSMREQRLEITNLHTKLRKHYDVTLNFRSEYPDGLIFYASDKQHAEYIALYLKDGILYHQVSLDSQVATVVGSEEVNDGKWHSVQFTRTQRKISLMIDDVEQAPSFEFSERNTQVMNIEFPLYVGGIPKHIEENVRTNIKHIGETFYYNGCIKDLKFNGGSMEREPDKYHVVPCSDEVEPGLFFNKPTGYVKLFERFTVGTDFVLNFDFRPREPDGLLFSVHGKTSYLILELENNILWFTVKSDSKNIVATNYTLPNNGSFCDGKWRNVQAIKSKFVITIFVDYISAQPGVGLEGSTTTKTNRALFMGGHQASHRAPGLKTRKTFKGCIRNIHVNKKPVRVSPGSITGEIWQGVCPKN